jgi:hypothetical protein
MHGQSVGIFCERPTRANVSLTPRFSAVTAVLCIENRLNGFLAWLAHCAWLKSGVNEIVEGEASPSIDRSHWDDGRR